MRSRATATAIRRARKETAIKLTTMIHKTYRAIYKINRATRTGEAIASGNPKRVVRLFERRALYSLFARFVNRVLR